MKINYLEAELSRYYWKNFPIEAKLRGTNPKEIRMNVYLKNRLLLFLVIILSLIGFIPVCAQQVSPDTFDITLPSMRFPHHNNISLFQKSFGALMVKPPMDLVEMAVQAPLLNFHMIYWLPWKLSVESDFTTLIASNQLSLGPRLSFSHNNTGLNLGWDVACFFGFLRQYGFDNTTHGWIHYPNISFGYKLKEMAFTLKAEAIVIASISTRSGDNHLKSSDNFFNGYTVALYIEQRIHKRKIFVVGFKENYVKYYWPTWMAFSTFNRYYYIPELNFSWIF